MRKFVIFFAKIIYIGNKVNSHNLINITRLIHFDKIHFFFFRVFLKICLYNICIFADHAYAVNPFIKRFPDENMKEEFFEELIKEILNEKDHVTITNKNNKEHIILKYNLLIAYVQKPSSG